MNPVLLHLYPADFRRTFGDEMAQHYDEATRGAGRRVRLRESADVAAHALRLRFRVGSAHPGGRFFAAIAPFALAATAAYAAFNLLTSAADWYVIAAGGVGPLVTVTNGCHLATLVGAVSALAGRRAWGGLCSVAGTVGASVAFLSPHWQLLSDPHGRLLGFLVAPVLVAALPLLCPPDLRPAPRVRTRAGEFALVLWALLLVAAVTVIDPTGIGLSLPWRLGVPTVAAIALAGRRACARIRTTARLAGAGAPFVTTLYVSGYADTGDVLAALGVLAVTALALRLRRRGPGTALGA
ncbi:hypothetical protein [Streptomyces sp. NPDC049813]|uniref:hypothetical protein n=1 Tax=Streptomyces sp. NPDC049813 TaxID=3365597 RepID=UPI00379C53CE